ncbi:pilus assembly protein PilP [Geobacter sp. SVR]|uniref:pilus assembly protein PilP n=1 Tax=Geobacter sp. SVR TaxID=2495594 RepID=UPI00143EF714|nr:pilus assembly protein PilP [Geobacter sp. SVR]BCS53491.1 type IV pilus assembly lipoprotein PilP [Geobacter sp. SVR]GCF85382.1 type IV pilus assembly lipoprotein PilP [Geobacter sp. SVR]
MTRKLPRSSLRPGIVAAVLLAVAIGQGCSKDTPQAPVQPAKPASEPAKQQVKAVQAAVSSAMHPSTMPGTQFDFSNKKDPFKPFVVVKAAPIVSPTKASYLPIHSFDVNQFRLIGIITGGRQNQAMVVDPNGKGYVLKVGMTIGRGEGRITAITDRGVQVLEQFRDDNGRVRREHISLTLPKKQ